MVKRFVVALTRILTARAFKNAKEAIKGVTTLKSSLTADGRPGLKSLRRALRSRACHN